MTYLPPLQELEQELARRNLLDYAKLQWPEYSIGDHHKIIADALERVERGECKRLMLFAPPRHGKSMLTSEFFPAWFFGRNPDKYIIHATYAQDLADDWGRKVRNQLADDIFPFPDCQLSQDSASQKKFVTTRGGSYFGLGVGGAATGRGAHLLLIDDPIKGREEADSETIRRKLKDWYKAVAYTRLMPDAAVVIMLTRWHYDDLAGWLLREHAREGWEVISFPAISGDKQALWPDFYPYDRLMEIKDQLGSRDWSALYQQEPAPDEGSIFDLGWFRRYEVAPNTPDMIIHSWDTGTKDEDIHDPSALTVWHVFGNAIYLVDVFLSRVQFPGLRRATESFAVRDNPDAILIEDKGSGQQLIQVLKEESALPVIAIEPVKSKTIRAQGVSWMVEAGRVFLPAKAPWLIDFETEVAAFPVAPHDDQVDSMTQALKWLANKITATSKQDDEWDKIRTAGRL
jgi:predicted phage terminase large subunit-like protein